MKNREFMKVVIPIIVTLLVISTPLGLLAASGCGGERLSVHRLDSPFILVAASDAPNDAKRAANYVCDGTNDNEQVSSAVANGGYVTLIGGTFTFSGTPVSVPSNTEIEILGGTKIELMANAPLTSILFENSASTAGNTNIQIHGAGIIDGNSGNQTGSPTQTAVRFINVESSRVDCYLEDFKGWYLRDTLSLSPTAVGDSYILANNKYINRHHQTVHGLPKLGNSLDAILATATYAQWDAVNNSGSWTANGAFGTLSWNTADETSGSECAVMSSPFNSAGQRIVTLKWIGPAKDITNKIVGFQYKIEELADVPADEVGKMEKMTLDFYDTSNTRCIRSVRLDATHVNTYKGADEWRWVFLDVATTLSDSACGANFSDNLVDELRISLANYTTGSWTAKFDNLVLFTPPNLFPNGAVTFVYDGPYHRVWDDVRPILQAEGYPAVVSTRPNHVAITEAGGTTFAQLQVLQEIGWDVCVYGAPSIRDLTKAEQEDRWFEIKEWFLTNGFIKGSEFLFYGGSQRSFTTDDMIANYFKMGRGAHVLPPEEEVYRVPFYPYGWSAEAYGTLGNNTASMANIDLAVQIGGWTPLFAHLDDNESGYTKAEFQTLVNYCVAAGVEVITMSELWRRITNLST